MVVSVAHGVYPAANTQSHKSPQATHLPYRIQNSMGQRQSHQNNPACNFVKYCKFCIHLNVANKVVVRDTPTAPVAETETVAGPVTDITLEYAAEGQHEEI